MYQKCFIYHKFGKYSPFHVVQLLIVVRFKLREYTFVGTMDAFRLYNRPLTAGEILANYSAGNIEFQTRTGSDVSPNDGSGWEDWKPITNEVQLLALDSDASNWSSSNSNTLALSNDSVIKMEGTGSLKATMGAPQVDANTVALWHLDETSAGNGAVSTFLTSGTYTPVSSNIEVLVVAGGGGGGSDMGGGGGGGGVTYNSSYAVSPGVPITVTVGNGGAGAPAGQGQVRGYNGGNSVFGSLTTIGGGGGASNHDGSGNRAGNGGSGGGASGGAQPPNGGSGGGGGYGGGAAGTGTPGQGYNGSFGIWAWYPGGGGGAGATGSTNPANGGVGFQSLINGTSYYWGGGGGGAGYSNVGGNGGNGGGGGGAVGTTTGGAGLNAGAAGGGGCTGCWAQRPGGNGGANTGGGGRRFTLQL